MSRKLKYRPGETIKGLDELVGHCKSGGWVYWFGRPKHPGWILSQQITTALGYVTKGLWRKAIKNEED
jgi:hypothetical protein